MFMTALLGDRSEALIARDATRRASVLQSLSRTVAASTETVE